MIPTAQQAPILEYNGNCVVTASPGSGKTFVVSEKIKKELETLEEYQGIIAVSFTNKASKELKQRSLANGINPKSSFFGTIDKFYLSEIILPFIKHLWGGLTHEPETKSLSELRESEQEVFDWYQPSLKVDDISDSHIEEIKQLYLKGFFCLDIYGILARFIFENSKACRSYLKSRYKSIFIDEYQDCDNFKHDLFLKIKNLNIKAVAVGDINQSIYEFAGGNSKLLKELQVNDDFKSFVINKNHRCHPAIINYSNRLLNPQAELLDASKKRVYLKEVKGNLVDLANWIDENFDKIHQFCEIEHNNQIAILAKSNRTAEIVSNNLKIPNKLFQNSELDSHLQIWSTIFANLVYYYHDKRMTFNEVIDEFTLLEAMNQRDKEKLNKLKTQIKNEKNITCLYIPFVEVATILRPNDENDKSKNILKKILNNEELFNSYKPASKNQINIMTLHKSKGLEFDVVFHLDLHEWILPSKRPGENNDFNNPIYPNWEQDLNLHYVGVTRAKNYCVLLRNSKRLNARGTTTNANPSKFLTINNVDSLRKG